MKPAMGENAAYAMVKDGSFFPMIIPYRVVTATAPAMKRGMEEYATNVAVLGGEPRCFSINQFGHTTWAILKYFDS